MADTFMWVIAASIVAAISVFLRLTRENQPEQADWVLLLAAALLAGSFSLEPMATAEVTGIVAGVMLIVALASAALVSGLM